MSDLVQRIRDFLSELRRRQMYRVAVTYAGAAFVVWQATALLVRALDWPEWVLSAVVLVAIAGFPVVVALAWMYEVGPEGLRPTPQGAEEPTAEVAETGAGWKRWIFGGLLALLAAGSLVWILWPHQTLAFGEGDSLILADFRNRTADSTLTGSLATAFRISLEQSPYLNVYPERKVDETLEQMSLDPDTARLTAERAREVATREGVPVTVVPAVSELAGTYRVGLTIYPAGMDEAAATASVEAESRDALLGALDDLAVRLRDRLGESEDEIDRHRSPLAEVTTPSFKALKLFSRGQDEYTAGHFAEARRLFRHALEVDSSFTGARAQLGMLVYEQFDRGRGAALLSRVVENADDLTEFESFMIRAFHAAAVQGKPEKAAGLYRSLIDLYPNRAAPHNNLGRVLARLGRPKEAAEHYRRALAIDSATHLYYAGLNNVYLYQLGRVDSALSLARRRLRMDSTYFWAWDHLGWAYLGIDSLSSAGRAYERALEVRPESLKALMRAGFVDLLRERPREALRHFRRVIELEGVTARARDEGVYYAGLASQRLGEDSAARAHLQRYRDYAERFARQSPTRPAEQLEVARALSRLGERERGWRIAQTALEGRRSWAGLQFNVATVAGAQNRGEAVLSHLTEALRIGYRNYIWIKVNPDLHPYRNEPRLRGMLDTLIHRPDEGG